MICYRDMTFCTYYEKCSCIQGKECFRGLTPKVEKAAEIWWGGKGAPFDQFCKQPKCFREKNENSDRG